ncbi:MAG: SusC/RagA family TonB-linked outer membrane protein [Gemmatimonadaceae bacterium]|nr:SusC/RagA family TonB-linked outer membrane protein [Chitinophagaceae bacterium]
MRKVPKQALFGCMVAAHILCTADLHSQNVLAYGNGRNTTAKKQTTPAKEDTNVEKQALITVLNDLNKTKGVYFLFSDQTLGNKMVYPVKDQNLEIEKILEAVLRDSGLRFKKVNDKTFVILSEKSKPRSSAQSSAMSEESIAADEDKATVLASVTGKVTDNNGKPVSGVNVTVKGTTRGTYTNAAGVFAINADKGNTLVFSFVGFQTREVQLGDETELSVSLEVNEQQMNEVVVTALGIRKESRRLGYAATKVNGDEFTKSREINIGNALTGKIAGVNSSGPLTGPGGSSRVTIRGNSSFGNNQPLYVINGIPMNNDNLGGAGMWGGADLGDGISSINPDDIEEMTVLKGGAAAALYGPRGKNGVILITTKTGKSKKALGIEFNSNFMFDKANNFTDWQDEYGQGTVGAKPANQAAAMQTGLISWGSRLDGSMVTLFDGQQHRYSSVSKDNFKDFYKTGTTFTNTLAISGGGENGTFRLSFGDLRNSSIYPNSKYNRNNVNLDLSYALSEKWTGQANVSYIKEVGKNRSNLSDAPGNGNYAILFLPANVDAEYLGKGYDERGAEVAFNGDAFTTNPFFAANKFQNNTTKDRLLGVASLRYSPFEWLYVQGRVANDFFAFNAQQITPTGTGYRPGGSLDNESTNIFNEMNMDLLIGVNKKITSDISLGVTAGGNLLKMKAKNTAVNANGLAFPYLYNPASATTRNATVRTPKQEVHSLYAAVELSYKNTLFINLTDRNDWSSSIPVENNSYNYPSINASYVFSENFKPSWLDFGKLRTGYAVVGADAPIFSTALYYNTNGSVNGNPLGSLANEIPNSAIEPLKVTELEIGTELKMLKNRLFLDFSWYNKQTLNDIVQGTVSQTSGYASALVNIGKLENKGIELLVGGVPVKTNSFKWTTSFNYAHNKNKVIRLAEGQNFMDVGQSRTQRGFIQHRIGESFAQVMVYDIKKNAKGEMIVGPTGLPQAGDALVSRGTAIHPVTGGWSNEVAYKNLAVSFLIDYKFGGVIYSGTNARAYAQGLHKATLEGRQGGIVVKGVNDAGAAVQTTVTAQDYFGTLANISSLQTYSSDFIKFRSFAITYNFDVKFLKNKVQGLGLSLVGRNLFYIKRDSDNIDPESNYNNTNAQGLEYASLPSVRSYGINLSVKF